MRNKEEGAGKEGGEIQSGALWSWPHPYKKTHSESFGHRRNLWKECKGWSWNILEQSFGEWRKRKNLLAGPFPSIASHYSVYLFR